MNARHAAAKYRGNALAALILLIAAGLAAYAAAASYDTVSAQAVIHGVSLPRLNPIGIDGGLFGIIIVDIAFTWAGSPIWWLRLAARVFAVLTVAANASAGWPDPVGVGLRVAAPSLFIIIVEAGRTFLLRTRHAAERENRTAVRAGRRAARERMRGDRIPRMRWLLDFRGTLAIWKRMRLWRETSYARAVSMELDRLAAIEKLAMKYGPEEWQAKAPADLAWMLIAGVRMGEALERVAELTADTGESELEALRAALAAAQEARADADARAAEASARAARAEAKAASRARKQTAPAGPRAPRGGGSADPDGPRTQLDIARDARKKADDILAERPDISGAALAEECGMKPRWGQAHKKQWAARALSETA
jgi:Protein of unknown function (DUF2637)